MSDPASRPPAPGDARAAGPRPPPGWRDGAWALLGLAAVCVTVVQLTLLAYHAAGDPDVAASTGGLLLAFVVTVVWLLTVYWIAAGAWRRTVWGCPFEHLDDSPRLRRCHRHRLLPATRDEPLEGPPTASGDPPVHGPEP